MLAQLMPPGHDLSSEPLLCDHVAAPLVGVEHVGDVALSIRLAEDRSALVGVVYQVPQTSQQRIGTVRWPLFMTLIIDPPAQGRERPARVAGSFHACPTLGMGTNPDLIPERSPENKKGPWGALILLRIRWGG